MPAIFALIQALMGFLARFGIVRALSLIGISIFAYEARDVPSNLGKAVANIGNTAATVSDAKSGAGVLLLIGGGVLLTFYLLRR